MDVLFMRHRCSDPTFSKIYVKITYNGERVELGSTSIKIFTENWDMVRKRVLPSEPQYSFKNEQLLAIENEIVAIYNDFLRRKRPFTVQQLKAAIKSESSAEEITFIKVFDLFLLEIKKSPDKSEGTYTKYLNARNVLLEFLIEKKMHLMYTEDFDETMLFDYRAWSSSSKKHKPITIHKKMQVIKQVTKWAKRKKMTDFDSLADIRLIAPDDAELIYLTDDQFQKLKTHKFRTIAKQEAADCFIVFCRTGFHYADLKEIINNPCKFLKEGIDGRNWLYKDRVKTSVTAKVPYFDEVEMILQKYGGWGNLPLKSNANLNDKLKLIADELDFPEKIILKLSVKAGRKTLADWLLNVKGWTVDGVKVLLGIKNSQYVDKYGKADERRVLLEILRCA